MKKAEKSEKAVKAQICEKVQISTFLQKQSHISDFHTIVEALRKTTLLGNFLFQLLASGVMKSLISCA